MGNNELATIFARLASGELSAQEVSILMRNTKPLRTSVPGRKRTGISASKAKWTKPIVPVQSWTDVQAAFQWALAIDPDNDPWQVFLDARAQYDKHCATMTK